MLAMQPVRCAMLIYWLQLGQARSCDLTMALQDQMDVMDGVLLIEHIIAQSSNKDKPVN